ncbi:hypothetical protein DDB_G0276545 [Dictyostelium discoideum AX4]|uniref:Enoyl reductase (ER) domain-containing protein n=1 Tax=Dictyostelium discoideum TaxID=44689 RepID=Q869N3_DICDI|nr:hypothetical protein DDB_G0276545 [Dictyostelium discoideum AX4]EAL69226.1 hypothetical protein DDB_G0276545 [Dictyostelium discoideum AX4]|eukprot:XP_643099.1 hypothetical protein DDB_G0276545 [Dictyostelium discoideum AX4]
MTEIKQITLDKYFERDNGMPDRNQFKITTCKFDENQKMEKDQIMIKLEYVSVDPYLRARMNSKKTFVDPFKLHDPINSGCIGKVLKSTSDRFKEGDHVSGYFDWKEIQIVKVSKEILMADPNIAPLSAYLGICGMPGVTAYYGTVLIGKPKKGETLVVNAAAGVVGTTVGQIGKILGLRVVGICGSDEKAKSLINDFHFDSGLNYHSPTYAEDLKKACPNGIDIFYENVGGEVTDDIGQRAQYIVFEKRITMQGFLVFDYSDEDYKDAFQHLSKWLKEGKMIEKHVINNGFDQIIPSFIKIFETSNKNIGKVIIKL